MNTLKIKILDTIKIKCEQCKVKCDSNCIFYKHKQLNEQRKTKRKGFRLDFRMRKGI